MQADEVSAPHDSEVGAAGTAAACMGISQVSVEQHWYLMREVLLKPASLVQDLFPPQTQKGTERDPVAGFLPSRKDTGETEWCCQFSLAVMGRCIGTGGWELELFLYSIQQVHCYALGTAG